MNKLQSALRENQTVPNSENKYVFTEYVLICHVSLHKIIRNVYFYVYLPKTQIIKKYRKNKSYLKPFVRGCWHLFALVLD